LLRKENAMRRRNLPFVTAVLIVILCLPGAGSCSAATVSPTDVPAATPGTTPVPTGAPVSHATHWNGAFSYIHDETVTANQCALKVHEAIDGTVNCTGTGQDILCRATGRAEYSGDENVEDGALLRHAAGSYTGPISATLEVGIAGPDEPSYYIADFGIAVPGAYDMVQIDRHDSGAEAYQIHIGTDTQTLDPNATVIVFDQDLPLQAPAPVACPNPRSTGRHHFRLALTPGR
jgi:hypothetical protein